MGTPAQCQVDDAEFPNRYLPPRHPWSKLPRSPSEAWLPFRARRVLRNRKRLAPYSAFRNEVQRGRSDVDLWITGKYRIAKSNGLIFWYAPQRWRKEAVRS